MSETGKDKPDWNKTVWAFDRVEEQHGKQEKKGWFLGREMIGRDKKINKGVYVGEHGREAIVVDDEKDPNLNDAYKRLLALRMRAEKQKGTHFKDGLLQDVFNLTKQIMPVDVRNVNKVTRSFDVPDTKVYLSTFFKGGVCRHQALLAGYILERLKKEGKISGQVSIDRNSTEQGGHAWVRYTDSQGGVIILDPAQNFIGYLKDVKDGDGKWPYHRESDLRKRKIRKVMQALGLKEK